MQNQCGNKILKVFVYNVRVRKISKKILHKMAKSKTTKTLQNLQKGKKWR